MKTRNIPLIILLLPILLVSACKNKDASEEAMVDDHGHSHGHEHTEQVKLNAIQFKSLNLEVDSLFQRNLGKYIETNGQLEVPPQNEASVTTILGSNIASIEVIEGDKVSKGQVLAYLSHPELLKLQVDYIREWNEWKFLESEYKRQSTLFNEKVSSGKEFQRTESQYKASKGLVKGLEAQLKLIGLDPDRIKDGSIVERIPLHSPIEGYIRKVEAKTGQYVAPETEIFEIVNIEHIHVDFMVFEKDAPLVKKGQKVRFTIESLKEKELEATIYSVGKSFEKDPKAVHLHAEITNRDDLLIPGMYARGRILVEEDLSYSLPSDAVVLEETKYFIFTAHKKGDNWTFKPREVSIGKIDGGWVEIIVDNKLKTNTLFVHKGAYQLMAELKKEEAEHSH